MKSRPKVFFEIRYPNLLGAGTASMVNDIIERAGGVNCLTVPKKIARLNLEAVIAADPDVYLVQQGPMNPNPEKVTERPNYCHPAGSAAGTGSGGGGADLFQAEPQGGGSGGTTGKISPSRQFSRE